MVCSTKGAKAKGAGLHWAGGDAVTPHLRTVHRLPPSPLGMNQGVALRHPERHLPFQAMLLLSQLLWGQGGSQSGGIRNLQQGRGI